MTQRHSHSQRVVTYFITSIFSLGIGINGLLRGVPEGIGEFSVVVSGIGVGLLAYSGYLFGRLSERQVRVSARSHLESHNESNFQ